MARIRRPKKIDGSEYTFGGGTGSASTAAASGDFIKIAKGHPNIGNDAHDGFIANNSTNRIMIDVGSQIPEKDQYLYFDNAFETDTGSFSIEYVAPTTALPSGISWSENSDSTDTDMGEARIYGTPNSGTEGTYTMKVKGYYSRGRPDEQVEITWILEVVPSGTTPQWNTNLPDRIIRNQTGEQTISAAPTTTYADATFTMSNVTGFASGVTPVIDPETGRVYVSGIGDIEAAATLHSYTVTVDLGPYGQQSQNFSGNIAYGDPYGARYFGPANANQQYNGTTNIPDGQEDTYFNPAKSSGALRRVWNVDQDTSPYFENDGYGCQPDNYWTVDQASYDNMSGYRANGYMGIRPQNNDYFAANGNHQTVKGYWTVPAGVEEICIVVVGAGGPGAYNWAQDGGGAGGLAWLNGISVTPGEKLQWCFGIGRYSMSNTSSYGGGPSWVKRHSGGPNTDFLLYASGGGWTGFQNGNPNNQSTSYTGGVTVSGINYWEVGNGYGANDSRDSGGFGVNTSEGYGVPDGAGGNWHYGGGAGYYGSGNREGTGAAGYQGNQASHGSNSRGYKGGGGYGYEYSSTYGEGGGGGVGLDGQGWRGVDGSNSKPRSDNNAGSGFGGNGGSWTSYNFGSPNFYGGGGGGSGGTRGAWGENQFTGREEQSGGNRVRVGGLHGGGGGGSGTSSGGGNGASGAVRIIWGLGADGTKRSFPFTYCSENPNMKYNGES